MSITYRSKGNVNGYETVKQHHYYNRSVEFVVHLLVGQPPLLECVRVPVERLLSAQLVSVLRPMVVPSQNRVWLPPRSVHEGVVRGETTPSGLVLRRLQPLVSLSESGV